MTESPALAPMTCRSCRALGTPADVVLDLASAPAADYFPTPDDPLPDPVHPLSMWCCPNCGLAQLTDDETNTSEPRAIEPQALRLQAEEAVSALAAGGLLGGRGTVSEFGSPHGGSWLGLFSDRGVRTVLDQRPVDIVVDSFGLMHEPDQRTAARLRADRLTPHGVLIVQFHSLEAIVRERQWNALRHGHFAYFSLSALLPLLSGAGLVPQRAWEFDLYGLTVMLAAGRADQQSSPPDRSIDDLLRREAAMGLTHADTLRTLQMGADRETTELGDAVRTRAAAGRRIYAYGAASRAVALLSRAGLTEQELIAVADASPGKQGRVMPETRIPIISPGELVAADPDEVLLLLPDLLAELSAALPQLAGRWRVPPYAD